MAKTNEKPIYILSGNIESTCSYEDIWCFLLEGKKWEAVIKHYEGFIEYKGWGKPSGEDKKIIKLFKTIMTRFSSWEEVQKSDEVIRLEQWLINDKSESSYWYPVRFWKTSFAVKWYSWEEWKKFPIVKYKKIKLSDFVANMLTNVVCTGWIKRDVMAKGIAVDLRYVIKVHVGCCNLGDIMIWIDWECE